MSFPQVVLGPDITWNRNMYILCLDLRPIPKTSRYVYENIPNFEEKIWNLKSTSGPKHFG